MPTATFSLSGLGNQDSATATAGVSDAVARVRLTSVSGTPNLFLTITANGVTTYTPVTPDQRTEVSVQPGDVVSVRMRGNSVADTAVGIVETIGARVQLFGSSGGNVDPGGLGDGAGSNGYHVNTRASGFRYNGTNWSFEKKPNASARIPSAAATTNATVGKAAAGDVFHIRALNASAAVKYLKIYNKATAPTVGTDTPTHTFAIPPSNGVLDIPFPNGLYFSTGIAFALTGGAADADTTALAAADVVGLTISYQ